MKRFFGILGTAAVGLVLTGGAARAVSGGGFSAASAADGTFIVHHGNSAFNNDSASAHSVVASGGAVPGGQIYTITNWVRGNGISLMCQVAATNLATGAVTTKNSATTTIGFTSFTYQLDLTGINGNFSLAYWCVLPQSNGNGTAEVIHVTSFGD
jgi:hypothetical protein